MPGRPAPWAFALTLLACGAPRQTAPSVASAPPVAPEPVVASSPPPPLSSAPPASVAVSPSPPPPPSAPPIDPRVHTIQSLADGSTPMASAIDPAQGVVVIQYIEATPDSHGRMTISSRHLCGAALARADHELRDLLTAALRQAGSPDQIDCYDGGCTVHGQEWVPNIGFHFAPAPSGDPRLTAIITVSSAGLTDRFHIPAERYIDRQLAAAHRAPCPTRH